jgi:alpha,alpha-trehalase
MTAFTGCAVDETATRKDLNFYNTSLFHDVQLNAIFPDSKTFVDCIPKKDIKAIVIDYEYAKQNPDFDLRKFVEVNFDLPVRPKSMFATDTSLVVEEHLNNLWPLLTRKLDQPEVGSSLIPLPYDYVVPGGRFAEIYYWDSYFTILGLKSQNRHELMESMVKNFAHLITSIGFIPNGNRSYYLSRSQPPFFSLIVKELETFDPQASERFLDAMLQEYNFWMRGINSIKNPGDASEHVVMMPDGTIMNRYWDMEETPRPEAYKEDYLLAQQVVGDEKKLYRDIRAAAESGWDFSSRWLRDGKNLNTIQTTNIIPVDLNCLMAHLEQMIANTFAMRKNKDAAYEFSKRSIARQQAIHKFCWDASANFFIDYNFITKKNTGIKSLAGMFPLFFAMTKKTDVEKIALVIQKEFLHEGGLVTTLTDTDHQWDMPNGWAPLQWISYQGFKNYGLDNLSGEIRHRWLRQNIRVYEATGKMMEKYNVMDTTLTAGGGEYPNQDGFGWTNGVALAFMNETPVEKK